jgi:hypothetical protein
VGALSGVAAVGAIVGGLLAIPFTGGLSAGVVAAGAAGLAAVGGGVTTAALNDHWYHQDGAALPERALVRDSTRGAARAGTQFEVAGALEKGARLHGSLWVQAGTGASARHVLDFVPDQSAGSYSNGSDIPGARRASSYAAALADARSDALNGDSTVIEQLANGSVWAQAVSPTVDLGKLGHTDPMSLHTSDPSIKAVVTPSGVYS